jgi:DNA-binding HxlR family transcriptional regulator
MTPSTLNAFLLRALRRMSPLREPELILAAKEAFGEPCQTSMVRERLRDLNDLDLVSLEADPDGLIPPLWSLTIKGQDKAKKLG